MNRRKLISLIRYGFNSKWVYRLYIRYKNINALFFYRETQIKDVVVCGIHRSGSTLLYNIISEVLRENEHVIDTYFDEEIKYKRILSQETSVLVKKNHTYLPFVANFVQQV